MGSSVVFRKYNAHLFNIGAFRCFGLVPIVVWGIIYFWCSLSFVFSGKGTPHYVKDLITPNGLLPMFFCAALQKEAGDLGG